MDISGGIEVKHAIAILAHGVAAGLFAFMPVWIITASTIKRLSQNAVGSNHEHMRSSEPVRYFVFAIVIMVASMVVYYILVMMLDYLFLPSFAPITGTDGITRLFWEIDIPTNSDVEYSGVVVGLLKTVEYMRYFFNSIAFFTNFMLLIACFTTVMNHTHGLHNPNVASGKGIANKVLPMAITIIIYIAVMELYSNVASPILNKDITMKELTIEYVQKALDMYAQTSNINILN